MTTSKSHAPASKTSKTAPATKKGVVAKKSPAARAQKTAKKPRHTVDYYPNRMTFWISAAAGSIIVLIAVIVAYNH